MNKHITHTHCLIALAVAIVLVLAFGVSAGSLVVVATVVACPLMMLFMMRAMMGGAPHGSDANLDSPTKVGRDR